MIPYNPIPGDRLKKNRGAIFGMIIILLPYSWRLLHTFSLPITVHTPTGWFWKSGDKNLVTRQSFLLIKKQQKIPDEFFY